MSERKPSDSSFEGWIESRRSFLKLAGFSFATALLPGCGGPDEYTAIPFLEKPEAVTAGRAAFYATLCRGCDAGCGVLAKNLDGRPIKIEGNPEHPLSLGRTCAVGQASLLGLYDSHRLKAPLTQGKPSDWATVDASIRRSLASIKSRGGAVRVLTGTVNGPTRRQAIGSFLSDFADGGHVQADTPSCSALLDAHERVFGVRSAPRIQLGHAQVIASFAADFLGTWISPVEFTRGYVQGRALDAPDASFSHHVQFESRMSLTGAKADRRVVLAPDEIRSALEALANVLATAWGVKTPWPSREIEPHVKETVVDIAHRLHGAPQGHTLVVCGVNDPDAQAIAVWLNAMLGNYRLRSADETSPHTLDLVRPSRQRLGNDAAVAELVREIHAGKIDALLVHGVNPVYDLPDGERLAEALRRIPLLVSLAEREDETAALAHHVCPDHHAFEAWDDAEPVVGLLTVAQPALKPLGETRAFVESLASFQGKAEAAYAQMRRTWEQVVHPMAGSSTDFEAFWERSVHDGYAEVDGPGGPALEGSWDALQVLQPAASSSAEDLALVLYAKVGLLDGRHAHNPWLQEMPDPVSKVAWDNCAGLSPATATALGLADGDIVRIETEGRKVEAPVLVQPGQHDGTVTLALGYGRRGTERFHDVGPRWIEGRPTVRAGHLVGVNAAPFRRWEGGTLLDQGQGVQVSPTGQHEALARSQLYHSLDVPERLASPEERRRPMVQQTTLAAWRENPAAGGHPPHAVEELWPDDHPYEGNHWGLAIDLSACTGCSACVVACQAENNIPVVGRDEVRRLRDMNWIRVDRYYQAEGDEVDVRRQPMMCQQCDNAPCETVCPVLATGHSRDGLNMQVYNRCVGTRYCANNCPYKVRRFNWFDYRHEDDLANLVLNPNVTVRTRGVMEKCTFCVQRISEARAEARREGRALADGDVVPACAQACPANAIVFGDTNDAESRVTERLQDPRAYRVLGELNVRPSVSYLTEVRDRDAGEGGPSHG